MLLLLLAGGLQGAELVISSGPGRAGPVQWQAILLDYRPAMANQSGWRAEVKGLRLGADWYLGEFELHCRRSELAAAPACADGRVTWQMPDGPALSASVNFAPVAEGWELELTTGALSLSGLFNSDQPDASQLVLELNGFDLQTLPEAVLASVSMNLLVGDLSGTLVYHQGQINAAVDLTQGGFDGFDGQVAGDGLDLSLELAGQLVNWLPRATLTISQQAGELLVGSLYLPSPEEPLTLLMEFDWQAVGRLMIDSIRLNDPNALDIAASAELKQVEQTWQLARLDIDQAELSLPLGWQRWADGHAAAAGFGGLEASGRLLTHLSWRDGALVSQNALLDNLALRDPGGRFALHPASGEVIWRDGSLQASVDLEGLSLFGLPLGATQLRAGSVPDGFVLLEPLRLPLLDGALVIDRLLIETAGEQSGIDLDARIEPLDLQQLTRLLGFPEFRGQLAGEFPGVTLDRDLLEFTGGIDIDAFSGQIRLDNLSVERPFGSLPALAAQVEIHRLDLLELTGAFNFGRMEGQVSGWMRDLRLLDWRPVAMDTRLFTHEDAPSRRISQRAVDNLSNLGGGFGGALIGGTILGFFEDFPYRRAGLACRLSNNICHIDGVAPHESGGFYIVEGRLLPRLDIIGYRRLVDWPQLLARLEAATR